MKISDDQARQALPATPRIDFAIISFRDFERLLRPFGFELERTAGSHRQYIHPAVPRAFPVQPGGKEAKRYQVREFLELVERYALHLEA